MSFGTNRTGVSTNFPSLVYQFLSLITLAFAFRRIVLPTLDDICDSKKNMQYDVYGTFYWHKYKIIKTDKLEIIISVLFMSFWQAFQSPDTLSSCVSFLRQHAVDTSTIAACLVVPKEIIAFPQVMIQV